MEIYLAAHDASVTLSELRADVQAAYDNNLRGLRAFTPETVSSLLDLVEEQHTKLEAASKPVAYKLDWPAEFGVGMKRFTFKSDEARRAKSSGASVTALGAIQEDALAPSSEPATSASKKARVSALHKSMLAMIADSIGPEQLVELTQQVLADSKEDCVSS